MRAHICLAALGLVFGSSVALAQTSTPAPNTTNPYTTKPMTTAPTSMPNGDPKYQAPPAARSGDKGLSFGPGSANGDPIIVERKP